MERNIKGSGTSRVWRVPIPAPKGTCGLTITLNTGADEAVAEKIAATLAAIKK